MTIADKVEFCQNEKLFTLFKEGLFYKCYNEDAMVFTQRVKSYKIITKYIKSIGDYVLSIGFPISEVENNKLSFEKLKNEIGATSYYFESNLVKFNLVESVKTNYQEFLKKQLASYKQNSETENSTSSNQLLVKMINEFDLVNSSPMQSILFVQELKKSVNHNL
jgi:hypothetical protein